MGWRLQSADYAQPLAAGAALKMSVQTGTIGDVPSPKTEINRPIRLGFLDGLRGVAALYVVVFHAYSEISDSSTCRLPASLFEFLNRFFNGNASVDVFIVLSGFCLGIPIAKSVALEMPGGVVSYIGRRARRILPAYYAACVLCLIVLAAAPRIWQMPGASWAGTDPPFSRPVVLSHLLLLHNLYTRWSLDIDIPLWSVATEWQIYFLLPVLLLPVWRRYGVLPMTGIAFAVGLALSSLGFEAARFWFLGLFALGVAASAVVFRSSGRSNSLPWGSLAALLTIVVIIFHWVVPWPRSLGMIIVVDVLVGVATMAGLIWGARSGMSTRPAGLVRWLSSAPMMAIGGFSYSLYLLHAPVLAVVHWLCRSHGLTDPRTLVLEYLCGLPLAILIAYLSSLAFERPWLQRRI